MLVSRVQAIHYYSLLPTTLIGIALSTLEGANTIHCYLKEREKARASTRELPGAHSSLPGTEEPEPPHVSQPQNWFTGNARDGQMCEMIPSGLQQLKERKFPGCVTWSI